ncbi:regulatory protein GemA [Tropicibacter naphthalenivorans]|uniref:Mu-like prophage protein gp16 n=1 Tax=Tropicibacter naphthalenivorans TaxID=441103 RepID=A0A0P1GGJ2_9RHOB|nr:regulatory protein GemA [Tropicibacter naphthalenivorans]CUH80722.1 Mu-like prophage protein gp16 [Tropicibacter naphthalenivorans]SMC89585.1 Protein of unknown function [Tropicibacter naphthalenivorans]
MTISTNQLKLLWTAKTKVRLKDDDFRVALIHLTGCTSTKELDTDGFDVMMGLMEWMGFNPVSAHGPNYGDRPGMASFRQIEFIRTLWHEYTGGKAGEDELNKWLLSKWKLSSLRFLRADKAGKVITALKVMKSRAA